MTDTHAPRRFHYAMLAIHLAAMAGGLVYSWQQWSDVALQQSAVDQARDTLDRLTARLASGAVRPGDGGDPPADPFLQATSATLAGADLQERVVSAIRREGGTVTSTQVDTSGAVSTPPAVSLTISCQMASAPLQALLYSLESGTPALFVDQLAIDAPDVRDTATEAADLLKISITVSAYWRGDGKS